jgi:hypothetical protein
MSLFDSKKTGFFGRLINQEWNASREASHLVSALEKKEQRDAQRRAAVNAEFEAHAKEARAKTNAKRVKNLYQSIEDAYVELENNQAFVKREQKKLDALNADLKRFQDNGIPAGVEGVLPKIEQQESFVKTYTHNRVTIVERRIEGMFEEIAELEAALEA